MFKPKLQTIENSPYTLKFNSVFRASSEEQKEWLSKYIELYKYTSQLEALIISLQDKNIRLSHENDFMVRMLKENNNESRS